MSAPIGDEDAVLRLDETVARVGDPVARPRSPRRGRARAAPDDRGHYHWMIRLRGEEKDVIALWLTLRQRTVHVETQLMPAPEENRETLYSGTCS